MKRKVFYTSTKTGLFPFLGASADHTGDVFSRIFDVVRWEMNVAEKHAGKKKKALTTSVASARMIMVGETGFEPATPCSQGRCAARLRYSPTKRKFYNTNHEAEQPLNFQRSFRGIFEEP